MENTALWRDRDAIYGAWEAAIWPPKKRRWEADASLQPGRESGAGGARKRRQKKHTQSSIRASDTTSRPCHPNTENEDEKGGRVTHLTTAAFTHDGKPERRQRRKEEGSGGRKTTSRKPMELRTEARRGREGERDWDLWDGGVRGVGEVGFGAESRRGVLVCGSSSSSSLPTNGRWLVVGELKSKVGEGKWEGKTGEGKEGGKIDPAQQACQCQTGRT